MENIKKYFDAIDIIYWINLDRSTQRYDNMQTILTNFTTKNERISAVDGKMLSLDEILLNFESSYIKKTYGYWLALDFSRNNILLSVSLVGVRYPAILFLLELTNLRL